MAEGSWMCGATWEEAAVDCMWHCISPMPDCYCVIWLFSVIYIKQGMAEGSWVCGTKWGEAAAAVAADCVWHCISPLPDFYCLIWLFSVAGRISMSGMGIFISVLVLYMVGWKALAANCFSQICVVFLVKQMISWVVWLITFPLSVYKLDK